MIAIGPARENDADLCARLMESTDPWITLGRRYEECLARLTHPEYTLLVARRESGEPVGFMLLHPRGMAGSPYLASIAVAPDARGQGLGHLLLERAEAEFPSARSIFLLVSSFNQRAYALYQRLGYQRVGEIPGYSLENASELIMYKRLSR